MNPLQRASRNRKIIYFGLIVLLFTISMMWRGLIDVPLGASTAAMAQPFRWASAHTIQSQAQRLEVWEADPNETDADVTGSAMQLMTTGLRGVTVTVLWLSAIEKQKRNDFHEFEQRVQMVTKLQPNFITPWLYQSWNIAYNVSVEMQGSGDMYFYIVRGIQLLAEGERRNKRSPDMRYWIAFYYQNKFGVSDQVETLQCLFDLSCIPPGDRNPDNLQNPATKEINRQQFQDFCERHPHFVRRLRGEEVRSQDAALVKRAKEKLHAPKPEDVIQFLRDNRELPSRYKEKDDLKDPQDLTAFPVLPPKFDTGGPDLIEADPLLIADRDYDPKTGFGYFCAHKAARAWFSYSLLLVPPSLKDDQGQAIPGRNPRPGENGFDPTKYRLPRAPMLIIFRQGAPRAQSHAAEEEQKEGWFDADGWAIDNPASIPTGGLWFPDADAKGKPVVVGRERQWSLEEWKRALAMWTKHGKDTGLTLDAPQLESLRRVAVDPATLPAEPSPEQMADERFRKLYLATNALNFYTRHRAVTNFPYFFASAEAEAKPSTVLARKTLWEADQARKNGDKPRAIELYKKGLERWKSVLIENPNFYRLPPPDVSDRVEEETYEYELAYLRLLVQDDGRVRKRANQIAHAAHAVIPFLTDPFPDDAFATPPWTNSNQIDLKWFVVENVADADFSSPFTKPRTEGTEGTEPWIREPIKDSIRNKQGLLRRVQAGKSGPGGPPPGAPGGPPPGAPGGPPGGE